VREPVCALSQPVHLVRYGVGDAVAAVEFGVLIAAGVFWDWPACCPQLAERRVQRVQAGTATSWCTREGNGPAAVARDLGSRSPRRGRRPAPTSVPVRPAPAATRHGRPGSGPAAPAGPSRSARRSSPAHRASRVRETGCSSGADGSVVTGTPGRTGRARAACAHPQRSAPSPP
jgi:hypothetical protein